MPLYEFRCGECNKVSEFQLRMSDPSPTLCPVCGQGTLTKIMSLPAFQLKGSGWYKDAYDGKSNKKPEAPPAEGAPKAEGASKSEGGQKSEGASGSSSPAPAPAAPAATPAPSKPGS